MTRTNNIDAQKEAHIKQLKKQALDLIEKNNPLVRKAWELNDELANPTISMEEKAAVNKALSNISNTLEKEAYTQRYQQLLDEIKQKEIELYGETTISSSSPFRMEL